MRWVIRLAALLPGVAVSALCHAQSVLDYHNDPDRSGSFTVPALSWERARAVHLDTGFRPHFRGHLYAQLLYWQPSGSALGALIVATESNNGT